MRVLITGATGLIGRELGKALAARGDTLVCLVRDVRSARRRLPFPATCHEWDHTREVPFDAVSGIDAIVNLAGEPIADSRWTAAKKKLIRESRVLGTRRLVQAVIEHDVPIKAFVQGSAIGYYGTRGDEPLTAASARGTGFLADVVDDWEAQLRPLALSRPEVRVPVVRTGVVLARQGGALAEMLPMFRVSAAGRLGGGRQWMSWIHLDDIVRLFVHSLDSTVTGILEGVAPRPASNREFTSALCSSLGVIENAPVPKLVIQALFGERAEVVLASVRIEPRATQASNFDFRFDSVAGALADLLAPLKGGAWQRTWEQWVPRASDELWPYFCDANNLEDLTPAFLGFRVLGQSTPEIGEGTLIDYRLKLEGIPITWQSRIESWTPPERFVDLQVKGPYASWRHKHEFIPLGHGTMMRDCVRYRLPAGWLGTALAGWKVASHVERIFEHRSKRIDQLFGG